MLNYSKMMDQVRPGPHQCPLAAIFINLTIFCDELVYEDMIQSNNHLTWQVPGTANDQDKMAALLESYERKLRTELMDFYGRMVSLERITPSSAGVSLIVETKQL